MQVEYSRPKSLPGGRGRADRNLRPDIDQVGIGVGAGGGPNECAK